MDPGWVAAIVGAAGTLLGVLGTVAVQLLNARGKLNLDQDAQKFAQREADLKAERAAIDAKEARLTAAYDALRNDLERQILDLRNELAGEREKMIGYVLENGELKARVNDLQATVTRQAEKIASLEGELQRERARNDGREGKVAA